MRKTQESGPPLPESRAVKVPSENGSAEDLPGRLVPAETVGAAPRCRLLVDAVAAQECAFRGAALGVDIHERQVLGAGDGHVHADRGPAVEVLAPRGDLRELALVAMRVGQRVKAARNRRGATRR